MQSNTPKARNMLALTARARDWLLQFDAEDRGLARDFLGMLDLVSASDYQRTLSALVVDRAAASPGPTALYAVRELDMKSTADYFEQANSGNSRYQNAVGGGSDIGSEGMTAFMLRNLALADKEALLSHPSLALLHDKKCRTLMLVDDMLGSGDQCARFLCLMWQNATIRSWWSYGLIRFEIVAFASTEKAIKRLQRHPSKPTVTVSRYCHTLQDIPNQALYEPVRDLLRNYGRKTSRNQYYGYGSVTALTIFEHRCPNNAPVILWAPTDKTEWRPLFPNRLIQTAERSIFPEELVRHDPIQVLLSVGEARMARMRHHVIPRPLSDEIALLLTLLEKGMRYPSQISYAMGLDVRQTRELIEKCVEAGLMTPRYRISDAGLTELKALKRSRTGRWAGLPEVGEDDYYPTALRSPQIG